MVIGLTGGIATGKTTVSTMLNELGAIIIDADQIAREVVQPERPTWFKLREEFGSAYFLPDGQMNRKKLGEKVFNDPEARYRLNSIIHPAIRTEMKEKRDKAINEGKELIVLDIPLLFESELEHLVEKILVVYIPEQIQKERLMNRDAIDERAALAKMSSQLSIEKKKNKGHAYIDNSGSREETRKQLISILREWKDEGTYETK